MVGSVSAVWGKVASTMAASNWVAVEAINGAPRSAGAVATWSRRKVMVRSSCWPAAGEIGR